LLARDDVSEVRAAEASITKGAWVSQLVEVLLNHNELSLQDADVVAAALAHFRGPSAVEFSDCLVLEIARKAGHLPVATFDRNFAKLVNVQRLG
jgi:predicted nucleic-acid-binding protein